MSNHSSRRDVDDDRSRRVVMDDVSVEISLAERSHRSHRSRKSHGMHSLLHSEPSHTLHSDLSLADYSYRSHQRSIPELLTLDSPPRPQQSKVPDVLSLPGHRRRPSHGNSSRHTREAAVSLPDRLPNHLASFGGLSLDHPSQHSRTPSLNNGDPIRNIVLRDNISVPPSVPEKPTSESHLEHSTHGGSLHKRPKSTKSMSFGQASYFYGNGVIVSGGPPDEVFTDEFGNKCAQYDNRSVIINNRQVSYAASRTESSWGSDDSNASRQKKQKFRIHSFPYRAVLFFFICTTLILLFLLLAGNRNNTNGNLRIPATTDFVTNNADDIFVDDDDRNQMVGESYPAAAARSASSVGA